MAWSLVTEDVAYLRALRFVVIITLLVLKTL
jgi:hypothetical protein